LRLSSFIVIFHRNALSLSIGCHPSYRSEVNNVSVRPGRVGQHIGNPSIAESDIFPIWTAAIGAALREKARIGLLLTALTLVPMGRFDLHRGLVVPDYL